MVNHCCPIKTKYYLLSIHFIEIEFLAYLLKNHAKPQNRKEIKHKT
jgi:hypothetical protein